MLHWRRAQGRHTWIQLKPRKGGTMRISYLFGSRPRVLRGCRWLVILFACALGATGLRASPLHVGTTVNDVSAHSFGVSNVTRAVAAAPDGTIYVGFFSADGTQVRVARSTDRGATFAPSV